MSFPAANMCASTAGRKTSSGTSAANDGPIAQAVLHMQIFGDPCGEQVINGGRETLGTISDVMIDMATGRIVYVLVAAGGFMGLGERLFPIPWCVLRHDAQQKCFRLEADYANLDSAPGFDKTHEPKPGDLAWQEKVHQYYRVRPYWHE